jgi:hypothetical protein
MRVFKLVVPATVVTALALGLLGAASASAAETVLCKVKESPCPEGKKWELTPFEAKAEPLKLLTSLGTIECASSTIKGALGMLNAPQGMALESLVFATCKMGGIGCTIKTTGVGGMAFLRTNVNLGEATLSNTAVLVECSLMHCIYEGEPVFHLLGESGTETAKFNTSELLLTTIGGMFCPKTTKLDAAYTILVPLPVLIQS